MLVSASVISCATNAPKPPYIHLNLHDRSQGLALCTDSDGKKCSPTPMSQTDNWYMLRPKYFQAIQDYIDLLKCKLDGGCASVLQEGTLGPRDQIELIRSRIIKVNKSLQSQRD